MRISNTFRPGVRVDSLKPGDQISYDGISGVFVGPFKRHGVTYKYGWAKTDSLLLGHFSNGTTRVQKGSCTFQELERGDVFFFAENVERFSTTEPAMVTDTGFVFLRSGVSHRYFPTLFECRVAPAGEAELG